MIGSGARRHRGHAVHAIHPVAGRHAVHPVHAVGAVTAGGLAGAPGAAVGLRLVVTAEQALLLFLLAVLRAVGVALGLRLVVTAEQSLLLMPLAVLGATGVAALEAVIGHPGAGHVAGAVGPAIGHRTVHRLPTGVANVAVVAVMMAEQAVVLDWVAPEVDARVAAGEAVRRDRAARHRAEGVVRFDAELALLAAQAAEQAGRGRAGAEAQGRHGERSDNKQAFHGRRSLQRTRRPGSTPLLRGPNRPGVRGTIPARASRRRPVPRLFSLPRPPGARARTEHHGPLRQPRLTGKSLPSSLFAQVRGPSGATAATVPAGAKPKTRLARAAGQSYDWNMRIVLAPEGGGRRRNTNLQATRHRQDNSRLLRSVTVRGFVPWKSRASTPTASRKLCATNGSRARRPATTWARRPSAAGCRTTGGATCGPAGWSTCRANASGSNSTAATSACCNASFHDNTLLLDRILDRLKAGQENLDIICWAHDLGHRHRAGPRDPRSPRHQQPPPRPPLRSFPLCSTSPAFTCPRFRHPRLPS